MPEEQEEDIQRLIERACLEIKREYRRCDGEDGEDGKAHVGRLFCS